MTNNDGGLLSPKGAATVLGLSTRRLAQLDNAGVLPAIHDDQGRRYWPREAIEKFAEQREAARRAIPR